MSTESTADSMGGDGAASSIASEQAREVELLDLLVLLARGRTLLIWTVVACLGLGVTYGLIASPEYKASARVVPESPQKGPEGIGGLGGGISALQGLGVNLGSIGQDGLSKDAYPEVLESREVRLAVVRDTFQIPDVDTMATLVEYFESKRGILSRLLDPQESALLAWFADEERQPQSNYPTIEEERAILRVQNMVTSFQSPQSGLMQISVTTGDPRLATQMVESFITHLTTRVRSIRTRKAREKLGFIRQRFEEARNQLSEAEDELAEFVDRNQNINTADLRTRRDRLERHLRFKSSLYSELQAQITQAELDLKRSEPVLTMVETPVPPLDPVSPQWLLIIFLSIMTGGVLGVGAVFIQAYFSEENTTGERQEKLRQIREAFFPERVASAIGERMAPLTPRSEEESTR